MDDSGAVDLQDWPEKFIYVCSATKMSVLNTAPIIHAGQKRIALAVVFCGAEEASLDRNDIEHALSPTRLLLEWLDALEIPRLPIYGPANDMGHWAIELRRLSREAAALGLPVLFNAAGGRTQMKLGALWPPMPEVTTIIAEPSPLRIGFVDARAGVPAFRPTRRDGPLFISDYVGCAGFEEHDEQKRLGVEKFFSTHAAAIDRFGETLIAGRRQNLGPALNAQAQKLFPKNHFVPGRLIFAEHEPALVALQEISGLPGITFSTSGGWVTVGLDRRDTAQLLCGTWLEAMLFNRLRMALDGKPAEIQACLALREEDGTDLWGEADLALLINDQLHIVEAKATVFRDDRNYSESKDAKIKAERQVSKFRGKLLGPFGEMWVINPLAEEGDIGDVYRSRLNAKLLLGPDALDRLVGDVIRLLPR